MEENFNLLKPDKTQLQFSRTSYGVLWVYAFCVFILFFYQKMIYVENICLFMLP